MRSSHYATAEEIEEMISRHYKKNDGETIRKMVCDLQRERGKDLRELKRLFSDDFPLTTGIATAAYTMETGNFKPCQEFTYGGLGIQINHSPEGLLFNRDQLGFSKIGGNSLKDAVTSGRALRYAIILDNALRRTFNDGSSLHHATIRNTGLEESENSGWALCYSELFDDSGRLSINLGASLGGAKLRGRALKESLNYPYTLMDAEIFDDALSHSRSFGIDLSYARFDGKEPRERNMKFIDLSRKL